MITKISVVYAPVPYIILETDNVITANGTQQAEIDFNELSAYINILTAQQTALGKYVNFFKGVYTVNNRNFDAIVIQPSDTPEPGTGAPMIAQLSNLATDICSQTIQIIFAAHSNPIVEGDFLFSDSFLAVPLTGFNFVADTTTGEIFALNTLTGEVGAATGASCAVPPTGVTPFDVALQLNGVAFTAPRNLNVSINGSAIGDDVVRGTAIIVQSTFQLPKRGGATVLDDYNFPFTTPLSYFYAVDGGANWNVVMYVSQALAGTLNIVDNGSYVEFENVDNLTPFTVRSDHDGNSRFITTSPESTFLKKDPLGLNLLYSTGTPQGWNGGLLIEQYEGVNLVSQAFQWWGTDINLFSINVTKVSLTQQVVRVKSTLAEPLLFSFTGGFKDFIRTDNAFPNQTTPFKIGYGGAGNLTVSYMTGDSAGIEIFCNVKKGGILLESVYVPLSGAIASFVIQAANVIFDELEFAFATTGTGFPISLKGAAGAPCGAGAAGRYIDHAGTIETGDVVYDDAALTIPHAGDTQIVDPNTGIIYVIDIVTGVVGAQTGTSCGVPAKNVFFINETGAALVMSTDTDPAINIPSGGNLTVACTPGGYVENDTAGSLKFTFLQSMPATLAPLEAPNPDTLIAGGQHTFDVDLATVNYCRVALP